MAIIRVNIETEKATFSRVFTDEQQALQEADAFLFEHELNDGCSLSSNEDFIALNAVLAEIFDDPWNAENFAQWDDITEAVSDFVLQALRSGSCLDDETLLSIANNLDAPLMELAA